MDQSMGWRLVALVLLAAGMWQQAHAGDIYKCKSPQGVTIFQQTPCPPTAKPVAHTKFQAVPDDPSAAQRSDDTQPPVQDAQAAALTGVPSYPVPQQPQRDQHATAADTGCQGIGCTTHQCGDVQSTRCEAPDGHAYYVVGECRRRSVYLGDVPRSWQRDRVQGMPDAVMVGPDRALDPRTGQTFQLEHAPTTRPVYVHTQDQGRQVDADTACSEARAQAKFNPRDARAAKRAHDVCNAGRGLWDQAPPSSGAW